MADKKTPKRARRPLTEIRQDNIDQILKAAERQFAETGFSGTTVAAIADAAGLPKPNVLYYFKSKEGLYRAVLKRILELWMEAMHDLSADDHPREALRDYIVRKIRQSRDYPDASKIFAAEILHGAPYIRAELEGPLKVQFDDTVEVIRAWIAKGWMEPVSPEHLLFTLWAATQSYADFSLQMRVLLARDELRDDDFDNGIELLTRLVLKGCGVKIV
jgi:TetR/AcrR family transcriptional regulator